MSSANELYLQSLERAALKKCGAAHSGVGPPEASLAEPAGRGDDSELREAINDQAEKLNTILNWVKAGQNSRITPIDID